MALWSDWRLHQNWMSIKKEKRNNIISLTISPPHIMSTLSAGLHSWQVTMIIALCNLTLVEKEVMVPLRFAQCHLKWNYHVWACWFREGERSLIEVSRCGSFDRLDLQSLNNLFFGFPNWYFKNMGLVICQWKRLENTFSTVYYTPHNFKITIAKWKTKKVVN